MTWTIEREQTMWTLAAAGTPPKSVEAVLDDETWAWLFGCWCADTNNQVAPALRRMLEADDDLHASDDTTQGDAEIARIERRQPIIQQLQEHVERFVEDATAVKAEPPPEDSEPEWEYTGVKVDSLDTFKEGIDTLNRWAFNAMHVGSPIEYRQAETWVLLGNEHKPEHYDWAYNQDRYCGGTVTRLHPETGSTDDPKVIRLGVTGSASRDHFNRYMTELFGDLKLKFEHTS